jgi:A/G-specific adenine glycosylase
MMDLGATICTPRRPSCMICPLNEDCEALGLGDPERFPLRAAKADRPQRLGAAFVAIRGDGAVLLRKRGENGLLGGMTEVPGTHWTARKDGETDASAAPFQANWQFAARVSHIFTHFALDLAVFRADVGDLPAPWGHWWSPADAIHAEALPTVMKKAIEAAIPGITKRKRH